MPAAMEYVANDSALRKEAAKELVMRRVACAKSLAYYRGQMAKHLKVKAGEADDNVCINLWKQAIDREVAFMFPEMPRLEIEETEETESEALLRKVWIANGGARLLRRMARNGCLTGHVFVKVIAANPQRGELYPRVVVLDSANVLVWWRADDYQQVIWYEIRWEAGDMEYRQDVIDRGDYWEIADFQRPRPKEATSTAEVKEADWALKTSVRWEYSLCPIIDFAHIDAPGAYYGDNEAGLLDLNDKINKNASDMSRILRFHASPKTVGTGFEASEVVATAIENFWTIDNDSAKVYNLEMQSDLASSMRFIEFLRDGFLAQKRVVVLSGSTADFQRVTNLGVTTVFADQLAKTRELKDQYTIGIVGISKLIRMLSGDVSWDSLITVHGGNPLPQDAKETIEVAQIEHDMGIVSLETVSRQRGYDWEQEQERKVQESDTANAPMARLLQQGA